MKGAKRRRWGRKKNEARREKEYVEKIKEAVTYQHAKAQRSPFVTSRRAL